MPSDKTVPQQIEELTEQTSSQAARIVELEAAVAAKADEMGKVAAKADADAALAKARADELEAQVAHLAKDVSDRDAKIAAQAQQIGFLQAQVDKTTKILAMHPDVAALFSRGEDAGKLRDGGGEAAPEDILAKYNAIQDRAEKRKFYAEHKAALQEAARKK